jgi:hypothetical protein
MQTSGDMSSFGPVQLLAGLAGIPCILLGTTAGQSAEKNAPVQQDGGWPVAQIATELGVTPEQYREAFNKVRSANAGARPTDEQRRANRRALAATLGVSPERLDEVMDKYRRRIRVDNGPQQLVADSLAKDARPNGTMPKNGDGSRTIEQIAKDLGVAPERFLAAFKNVRPAEPGARPTDEDRLANRNVLSATLGVSPELLNEVMDKYRRGGGDNAPPASPRQN